MVTAFFDSRSDAENAVERLAHAGVPRDSVRLIPDNERDPSDDPGISSRTEPRGFWTSLEDWLLPEEDRHTYAEGLSRGGYLVSVNTGEAHYARVVAILDAEGTIDIDERAENWRSEGWSGMAAGASTTVRSAANRTRRDSSTYDLSEYTTRSSGDVAAADAGLDASVPPVSGGSRAADLGGDGSTMTDRGDENTGVRESRSASADASLPDRGERVIPVAEERLRVGKRDVSHGRVRVRSYVVETPVEEQVTLREEHVAVERRPADRAEEAAISKEVRVTEEVIVHRVTEQRTETISDTVRQTEVEVEDQRGNQISGTGTLDRT
jgi:hypothetical protein